MKVTCIKCNQDMISIGKHVEDFKDMLDQYVCLGCKAKKED